MLFGLIPAAFVVDALILAVAVVVRATTVTASCSGG